MGLIHRVVLAKKQLQIEKQNGLEATPGHRLRELRRSLGLTLRSVETATNKLAVEYQCQEFAIPFSRLFEIESKGMLPTIYRLYSLSVVYRSDYCDLLLLYGISLDRQVEDLALASVPVTHKIKIKLRDHLMPFPVTRSGAKPAQVVSLTTSNQNWEYPAQLCRYNKAGANLVLVHVGTEDYTMFPLIAPSSFLQVDGSIRKVRTSGWRSEHDRPIYLVDTRQDGCRIGWCSLSNGDLTIQPHPLSPTPTRSYRYPQEAEVVGQVVAVSTRLMCSSEPELALSSKEAYKATTQSLRSERPVIF